MSRLVRAAERIDLGSRDVWRNAKLGLTSLLVAVSIWLGLWSLGGASPWLPDALVGTIVILLWIVWGFAVLLAVLGFIAALVSGAFWWARHLAVRQR